MKAIDLLDKSKFGEVLIRALSGEKGRRTRGMGDHRGQLFEDWPIMCQALCQEIKIDGEPDGLSTFEEPTVQ